MTKQKSTNREAESIAQQLRNLSEMVTDHGKEMLASSNRIEEAMKQLDAIQSKLQMQKDYVNNQRQVLLDLQLHILEAAEQADRFVTADRIDADDLKLLRSFYHFIDAASNVQLDQATSLVEEADAMCDSISKLDDFAN